LYVITCGAMCVSLLALLVQKHKYRRFHHLRRDARHLHAVKELHKKKCSAASVFVLLYQ
jgi:hypothetical protein